jgi:exopolysaccharide biosynthesis polyprenyl glycosylphosphotransferase
VNEAKRQILSGFLKFFDLALMVLAFGLATSILVSRSRTLSVVEFFSLRFKLSTGINFVLMLVVWNFIFRACDLYESRRLSTRRSESLDAVVATSLATGSLGAYALIAGFKMITPTFLTLFWMFASISLVLGRFAGRQLLRMLRRRGRNVHHIVILGTNPRAIEFANRLQSKPELGYRIVGFVDEDWTGTREFKKTQHRLCCDFDGLSDYLRHNVIDEVAIYLPLRSFHEKASQWTELFEKHGIAMRFGLDIFNLKISRSHADLLDGDPHITARSSRLEGWAIFLKRSFDFVVSLLLLIPLAPLLLLVALMVKISSEGPVFFRQKRVGLNKRHFVMFKFRTMILDAERIQPELLALNEMTGPVFKIKNDPRITPLGRFLRRTSIDELPQLLNVLSGDMSLVGPRAMSLRDYQFFNEDWQRRRFSVRPGITCLWQVKGRSSIPFEQWMELDMQYIDRWSLWLDLKILALTIPAVLKGSGAA